ncbi:hypothetical protein [Micromonospora carbonacea]|uniref:Uncharacterized protein n=1 Tax=Micromonospora carbonacea TaxID=47853 RepID=A0A1C5ACY7_9ACTN|nr:hypothetical protein [Micromonospora carbonacea]SCF42884.1 hypothetical protein GA0070563_112148 [Micromonospora carbonacea]
MTTTTLIEDAPLPGMPDLPDLWAVHIEGPDELVPFLDKADAEKFVDFLDGLDGEATRRRAENKGHTVFFNAKLIPWPYSREAFAEALREASEL